jgi:proliferating cell nuclear antigen PCNA
MKFTITDKDKAKAFSSMFQNMKLFSDHINLMFEPHRLYAQGMDSSHISVFEIIIPNTWFDSYWQEGNDVLGINTVLFHKILGTREDAQHISVEYNRETDSDKLYMHFSKEHSESVTAVSKSFDKHFELPLVELESDLMEIPDVDYQAEFALASSNFASLVGQLKQFGSDLFIKCNEEELRLTSKSNESGNMSVVVPIDDLSLFAINEGETINMSFSLIHLHNICAFHKVCDSVNLKISENYPLKTTYLLEPLSGEDDDDSNKARIVVFLAPRISDDDE